MAASETANIRRFLTRRCAKLGIPVCGTFELTPRCNLQCKMCYIRLTPEQMRPLGQELTADEWVHLAQEARSAGMVFLLLTGGEPTLRSDFCEIYEQLAQMGFSIAINTNGTNLTPDIRKLWEKWPPSQVNVTLYGVCEDDYAALCGNPKAFTAVTNSLNWLKEQNILVHLNTTMAPQNKDMWEDIERFAIERGLELRLTSYCFPPLRRSECGRCEDFSRLTPEEAAELSVKDILFREGADAILRRASRLNVRQDSDCALDVGEPMQCVAGKSQFWVAWNGSMSPCGMLDQPSQQLLSDSLSFQAHWDQLREKTDQIRLCTDCANCEQQSTCLNCAAVTYTETGKFDGKPEYMCQFNRAYREALTKTAHKIQEKP